MLRTKNNGELRASDVGETVQLCGWVHSWRDHGGVIFIDLRDRYGLTQIVFDPEFEKKCHGEADGLRREDCIQIEGEIKSRKEGMVNPNLPTGEVEVFVKSLNVLNKSETPPIEIDDRKVATDDVRMKYRYLDLRRPQMQKQLAIRHQVCQLIREYFNGNDFLEIETPVLIRATPEGARDYLVPSRVNAGKFYALPQSPQLYKQILMVSGCEKYYQIARCFRDEDLRTDRQPEFTQLDVEMSFVTEEDIYEIMDKMIAKLWKDVKGVDIKLPIPQMTYKDAMDKYGIDRPDLRFGMELTEVSEIVAKSEFGVFKTVVEKGGIVKAVNPEHDFTRNEIDSYIDFCQKCGAKGMAWMRVTEKGLESNIAKYFPEDVQKELLKATGAKPGSILMFIADKPDACNDVISRLRLKLGDDLGLRKQGEFNFVWIVDFPVYEWDEDHQRWSPMHHIFSMPKDEHLDKLEDKPGEVLGKLYDLCLNGTELGGGSIRIHRKDIQERVLKVIGMDYAEAEQRFGFLLEAFKYGAPPHGGIAFGLDRLVAMLCDTNDIREVIAFPKNKAAQCPMDGAPSDVELEQLNELHIKKNLPKKVSKEKS